ncbi:hypothetical protein C8R47DRAFT_1220430 [Mycena vitilis]|nr:hypothetical protein C8R47DRAFT_1220430 [Mycena vitilis]
MSEHQIATLIIFPFYHHHCTIEMSLQNTQQASLSAQELLEQCRRTAMNAVHSAQQRLSSAPPAARTSAFAELERCRRHVLSLSAGVPTSSDEEIGAIFPSGRRGWARPTPQSSDGQYVSSSSSSSGGSSERDLQEKEELVLQYRSRPADVIERLRALDLDAAAAAATASTSHIPARPQHDAACRSLRDEMAHCNCTLKKARLARRKARKEDRLRRWLEAMLREEARDITELEN